MSRDELAARLFVVLIAEREHDANATGRENLDRPKDARRPSQAAINRGPACATQALDLADAFELERKRRLAQPAVVDTEGE